MHWIAPSENDTDAATLEERLWDAVEQAVPAPHIAKVDCAGASPEGILDLSLANLRRTRDLLLPRLLSGQIPIEDN